MSKVVAIMSMSLDGYVADANDGVAEVFDWYFSGDVEFHTGGSDPMTFKVSKPSAEHLRGLVSVLGTSCAPVVISRWRADKPGPARLGELLSCRQLGSSIRQGQVPSRVQGETIGGEEVQAQGIRLEAVE